MPTKEAYGAGSWGSGVSKPWSLLMKARVHSKETNLRMKQGPMGSEYQMGDHGGHRGCLKEGVIDAQPTSLPAKRDQDGVLLPPWGEASHVGL